MFLIVTCQHASGACQSHSHPVLSLREALQKYIEPSSSTPPFLTLRFHEKDLTPTSNLLRIRLTLPPLGHILSHRHHHHSQVGQLCLHCQCSNKQASFCSYCCRCLLRKKCAYNRCYNRIINAIVYFFLIIYLLSLLGEILVTRNPRCEPMLLFLEMCFLWSLALRWFLGFGKATSKFVDLREYKPQTGT
jgi:hypothetical protein